jgi:CO/xanthine dehydrogenase Mo-binding subunit
MVATVKPKTKNFEYIGTNVKRFDAYPKASGRAVYFRDVSLPNMLYAEFYASPYPNAKITAIDTTKAAALPGVRAILTYATPDTIAPTTIPVNKMVTMQGIPFISQQANWEGEYMGAVVCADTKEICDAALELLNITWNVSSTYYTSVAQAQTDPTTLQMQASYYRDKIATDFPKYTEDPTQDVVAGLKAADITISDTITMHQFPQTGAEPSSAVATWNGNACNAWLHGQTYYTQVEQIAASLGIPTSALTLNLVYQGGQFGQGQLYTSASSRMFQAVAVLSAKLGQPVKMEMSRKDYLFGGEPDVVDTFTVGAKKDGTITAVKGNFLIGQGAPGASGLLWVEVNHIANWVRMDLTCPYTADYSSYQTNTPPKWWCRSEQNQNARFLQTVIDHVADALGMDPTQVFLKNARTQPSTSAIAVINQGKQMVGWDQKWHLASKPVTLPNGNLYGIGCCVLHSWGNYLGGNEDTTGYPAAISAGLRINTDGTVTVLGAKDSIGCNEQTTYATIVAEELGMKIGDVYYSEYCDTNSGYNPQNSGGSAGCHGNSWLFAKLAIQAKAQVLALAATTLKTTADKLDIKDSVIFVTASPTTTLAMSALTTNPIVIGTQALGFSWAEENMFTIFTPVSCYQATFPEVEVNPNTGLVTVTNVVQAYDVGKALRPSTVTNQLNGNIYMGMWRGALESDIIFDPQTGRRLNADFINTQISTTLDIGTVNAQYMEVVRSEGAYGNTGCGEQEIATLCGLVSAVHNATGKWVNPPLTPENVLKALGKV